MKLKIASVLLIIAIVVVIFLANTGLMPPVMRAIYDFDGGDKLGHFLSMGLLSFMLNWTMTAAHLDFEPATAISKLSAVLMLVVAAEEYSQRFFPRRTSSWFDLAYSFSGLLLGAVLVWFFRRQAKNSLNS